MAYLAETCNCANEENCYVRLRPVILLIQYNTQHNVSSVSAAALISCLGLA